MPGVLLAWEVAVVSPDGKYMAFSLGKADEPSGRIGAGYGIYLLELEEQV